MDELEKNKNKRKIYISLLVSVICIIGVSYAFFVLYLRQSDNNAVTALTCFNTTLTEENSAINLTDEYPITDEDGLKKTPFTFKITNNCSSYVKAYITLDPLKEGTSNYILSKYMKANVSAKGSTGGTSLIIGNQDTKVLENKDNGFIVKEVLLSPNASKEYDLRIWIDYDTTKEQASGMTYLSQVVVVTEPTGEPPAAPDGWYEADNGTLLASLRESNELKTPLTTPGKAISLESEALLASTKDDYGTSYYYRGAVVNNYVEFANKCWRIVRIAGNGTIKLILHNDNVNNVSHPCQSSNNSDTAAFAHYNGSTYVTHFNTSNNDNVDIGFMFGTAGASTYAETHANTNKSTILTNLETWYANNLASYEGKLADTIWCNDKSTSDSGYGGEISYYGPLNRNDSPTLVCPKDKNGGKLSKFTVSDTTNGNGALTYKIGAITTDELAFAGGVISGDASSTDNLSLFLQENTGANVWWTLSPTVFMLPAWAYAISNSGAFMAMIWYDYGLRPMVSLVSSVEVTGSGTSEDPYVVK